METNERKRVYPSQQLTVALSPQALKVLMWICGWGSSVKYFPKQFAKACKMEVEEVEIQIQTLVDANLITVNNDDGTWILSPNAKTFQKYFEVPLAKVLEGNGIQEAKCITWKDVEKGETKKDFDSMDDAELKRLLLRIQASLNEREQVKKVVKTPELPNDCDSLPF